MVEYESQGQVRYPEKLSPGKVTLGGAKQVYRQAARDFITAQKETAEGQPLLAQVMERGETIQSPSIHAARDLCAQQPRTPRNIEVSENLRARRIL